MDTLGFSDELLLSLVSSLLSEELLSYGGYKSIEFSASSGIPQGSNLGPSLFLIFIDDLSGQLSKKISFFADDLKLHCKIEVSKTAIIYGHHLIR